VLRRGDNVKIHSVCNKQESGYTVVLFLSQLKDRNDYGEVLFFQDVSLVADHVSRRVGLSSCYMI